MNFLNRHCERSEAIHSCSGLLRRMLCILLAMTTGVFVPSCLRGLKILSFKSGIGFQGMVIAR